MIRGSDGFPVPCRTIPNASTSVPAAGAPSTPSKPLPAVTRTPTPTISCPGTPQARQYSGSSRNPRGAFAMLTSTTENTLNKHIRVDEDHWARIEAAANRRGISPSRLQSKSILQAIEGGQWPRTEVDIRMYRSCLFTAQILAHDFLAAVRGGRTRADPLGYPATGAGNARQSHGISARLHGFVRPPATAPRGSVRETISSTSTNYRHDRRMKPCSTLDFT